MPPLEAQLAVDKLRLAAQIATSQPALSMVVSSAGMEREELVQALELAEVVVKDEACESSSTACFATHLGGVLEQMAWTMGCVAEDFPDKNGS